MQDLLRYWTLHPRRETILAPFPVASMGHLWCHARRALEPQHRDLVAARVA